MDLSQQTSRRINRCFSKEIELKKSSQDLISWRCEINDAVMKSIQAQPYLGEPEKI